jgi:hypothetical protein
MDTHVFDKFKINKPYNLRRYEERRLYVSSGMFCAYIVIFFSQLWFVIVSGKQIAVNGLKKICCQM